MSEVNGINGHKPTAGGLQWKVGIVNSETNKYLTAEKFGFKINVTGTALKSKQIFTLEQDLNDPAVYIRSWLGRYLTSDKYGEVKCEAEEPEEDGKFTIEYKATGQWTFKHFKFSNYLQLDSKNKDNVKCFAQDTSKADSGWTVQLSIHPQLHLRNINRKKFAHSANDEIQFTELTPWGQSALIFLEFVEGKYALRASDGRYLHKNGGLMDVSNDLSDDAKFSLEIKSGANAGLAFKDDDGRYLTAVGATASMKGRNKTITKDELFTIEDSHPQVVIIAHNEKKASIKYGVDVSANPANQEEEETEKETFQLEYDATRGTWSIKTTEDKYWAVDAASSGIEAKSKEITDSARFVFEWQEDGSVALRASNKKYVHTRQSGGLVTTSDTVGDAEKFRIKLINRPQLVLRAEYGFVGVKGDTELTCSRVKYDIITLEAKNDGKYAFKASNGKYWSLDGAKVVADGEGPTYFNIEFHGCSKLLIRAPNGNLLKGEQNGLFKADGTEVNNQTLWEF